MLTVEPLLDKYVGWYSFDELRKGECIFVGRGLVDSFEQRGKVCTVNSMDNARSIYGGRDELARMLKLGKEDRLVSAYGGTIVVSIPGVGSHWNTARGSIMPLADFEALSDKLKASLTEPHGGLDFPGGFFLWELFDGEKVRG